MLKQLEGSRAVAEAVAMPAVICAYPITPQTHIVEALGEWRPDTDLSPSSRCAPLEPTWSMRRDLGITASTVDQPPRMFPVRGRRRW